jgi:hypothetical protein
MYSYEEALFLDLAGFHQQVDPPSPLPPYRYPRHPQIMYFYKEALFLDLAAFHQQVDPPSPLPPHRYLRQPQMMMMTPPQNPYF